MVSSCVPRFLNLVCVSIHSLGQGSCILDQLGGVIGGNRMNCTECSKLSGRKFEV